MTRWLLQLLGHPQFFDPRGEAVEITSRKTTALVALLATADNGIRSRVWLQQKLWGSREARQSQSSLRRELSSLRKVAPGFPLVTTYRTVALDLTRIECDIDHAGSIEPQKEFLEGIDIPGEEDFEEWLRETRSQLRSRKNPAAPEPEAPPPLPSLRKSIGRPKVVIHPIETDDPDMSVPGSIKNFVREVGAGLVARRWFEVRFENGNGTPADTPGYDLRSTLLAASRKWVLVLQLVERTTGKIIGTDRQDFGATDDPTELHEATSQAVNLLIEMIASSQARIAFARTGKDDGLEALLWEARRHGGQFSPKRWLSEREALSQTERCPEILAERIRMDLFVRFKMEADIGDLEDLHRACKNLAQVDWSDPRGPLFLGSVKFLAGKATEARELIGHAYKLDRHNSVTVGMVGLTEMAAGNWATAADWLERARRKTRMDRSRALNLVYSAICDLQLGHAERAAAHAQLAYSLAPAWPLALAVLVAAERESGKAEAENLDERTQLPREKICRLFEHLSLFGSDVRDRIWRPIKALGLVPEMADCPAGNP